MHKWKMKIKSSNGNFLENLKKENEMSGQMEICEYCEDEYEITCLGGDCPKLYPENKGKMRRAALIIGGCPNGFKFGTDWELDDKCRICYKKLEEVYLICMDIWGYSYDKAQEILNRNFDEIAHPL